MKNRLVVLTDIYRLPNDKQPEIDDVESMVRLLLYANEIDLEGLIATSSFALKTGGTDKEKQVILDLIDRYEAVLENLRVHDSNYPDAEFLRSITAHGIPEFGKAPGEGFRAERYYDNEGVKLILDILKKDDDEYVWFTLWGGCNTLAQAIWQLEQCENKEEFERLIGKVRIYAISDQDYSGMWLRRNYAGKLFYIVSPSSGEGILNGINMLKATWSGMCHDGYIATKMKFLQKYYKAADVITITPEWLKENIQGTTPYRSFYPLPTAAMEGDTPSFLGLIPNGLNDLEHPNYGGWGGRYEYKIPEKAPLFGKKEKYPVWTDTADTYSHSGVTVTNGQCTIYRWREAVQNDFAARMQWTELNEYRKGCHAPVVDPALTKDVRVKRGDTVNLSASASKDPDGKGLNYNWYQYKEAGTGRMSIDIQDHDESSISFTAPETVGDYHIILEVSNQGKYPLTRYARVIIHVL